VVVRFGWISVCGKGVLLPKTSFNLEAFKKWGHEKYQEHRYIDKQFLELDVVGYPVLELRK
jgi:hypothetical protein